jgi:hypothetical protein
LKVAPTERTDLLTVRVTPEEMAMVKELAAADGVSASDLIRQFIRRSHAERFGAPKPKRPKPK